MVVPSVGMRDRGYSGGVDPRGDGMNPSWSDVGGVGGANTKTGTSVLVDSSVSGHGPLVGGGLVTGPPSPTCPPSCRVP